MSVRTVFYYNKPGDLEKMGSSIEDITREEMLHAIFKMPPAIRKQLLTSDEEDIIIDKATVDEDTGKNFIRWLNENPLTFYNGKEVKYISLYDSQYESSDKNIIVIHRNRPFLFKRMHEVYKEVLSKRPQLQELYFKFRYGAQFFTYILEKGFPETLKWEFDDFVNNLQLNPDGYRSISMIEIRIIRSISKGFEENGIRIETQRGPHERNSTFMWIHIDYGEFNTQEVTDG